MKKKIEKNLIKKDSNIKIIFAIFFISFFALNIKIIFAQEININYLINVKNSSLIKKIEDYRINTVEKLNKENETLTEDLFKLNKLKQIKDDKILDISKQDEENKYISFFKEFKISINKNIIYLLTQINLIYYLIVIIFLILLVIIIKILNYIIRKIKK